MSFTSLVSSLFSTVYADAPAEEPAAEEPTAEEPKAEEPEAEETPEASAEAVEEEEEPEDVGAPLPPIFSGPDVGY